MDRRVLIQLPINVIIYQDNYTGEIIIWYSREDKEVNAIAENIPDTLRKLADKISE